MHADYGVHRDGGIYFAGLSRTLETHEKTRKSCIAMAKRKSTLSHLLDPGRRERHSSSHGWKQCLGKVAAPDVADSPMNGNREKHTPECRFEVKRRLRIMDEGGRA